MGNRPDSVSTGGPSRAPGTAADESVDRPPLCAGQVFVPEYDQGGEAMLVLRAFSGGGTAHVYEVVPFVTALRAGAFGKNAVEKIFAKFPKKPGVYTMFDPAAVARWRSSMVGFSWVLKILRNFPDSRQFAHAKARMEREVKFQWRLANDPGFPRLLGYGTQPWMYMVLEFVPGKSLERILSDPKRLNERKFLRVALFVYPFWEALLERITILHDEVRIIHRDLKPDNVIMRGLRTKSLGPVILDSGIAVDRDEAQQMPEDQRLTRIFGIVGTPQYVAPEQARGERCTPKTDLFSLGRMMCEMFRHDRPFETITDLNLWSRFGVLPECTHPELSSSRRRDLTDLCQQMCAPDPAHRLESASDVLKQFRAIFGK